MLLLGLEFLLKGSPQFTSNQLSLNVQEENFVNIYIKNGYSGAYFLTSVLLKLLFKLIVFVSKEKFHFINAHVSIVCIFNFKEYVY